MKKPLLYCKHSPHRAWVSDAQDLHSQERDFAGVITNATTPLIRRPLAWLGIRATAVWLCTCWNKVDCREVPGYPGGHIESARKSTQSAKGCMWTQT